MRKVFILPLIAMLTACGGHGHNHEEHHHEHEHHAEAHHSEHGEIVLHKEVADRFGVEIDTVAIGDFATTVRAAGVVHTSGTADAVVSAPTSGILRYASGIEVGKSLAKGSVVATIDASGMTGGDQNLAARAALDAARTEYERMEALYADRLVTLGECNAALAAYNQAKTAYSPAASTGRAVSPVAGTVTSLVARQGQYVEAGDVIATVVAPGETTLRIDLPLRYQNIASTFTDALIELPYGGGELCLSEVGGHRLSRTPAAANGATSYLPLYFDAGNAGGLAAGSVFTAYLLGTPRHGVVSVPLTAISEQQGDYFVYEQLDEDCYAKRRVVPGESDGRRVELKDGPAAGTPIVGKGVTTVRLAETGSNIPEGHTHNH